MAWQNLLDYDPSTEFDVYRNGALMAPIDYAANGVSVDVLAGRVTLTFPNSGAIGEANWEVVARPSAPVNLPCRLREIDGTPWVEAGSGEPYATRIQDGDPPPPMHAADLGIQQTGNYTFAALTYEAFGMGANFSPS